MNYEIVELEEKIVVGICDKTSNDDPKMGEVIGNVWKELFATGKIADIKNRSNDHTIGLYSDYTENGYDITAGCEVTKNENAELVCKIIPAGKYAKFVVKGDSKDAVGESWGEIWRTELDRTFTGDFEEYIGVGEDAIIEIYIAIK